MCTVPSLQRFMLAVLLSLFAIMAGCTTYGERVAPVPLPAAQEGAVNIEGASVVARAFLDPRTAERAFGFNIRNAGLLPIQFVVDNQSGEPIAVEAQQTLLIDQQGNAWPLLSAARARERVSSTVSRGESIKAGAKSSLLTGLAGAVAGAAYGIVTGQDVGVSAGKGAAAGAAAGAIAGGAARYATVGQDVRRDLEQSSLQDRVIHNGELAHGYLFFPGNNEASSVQSLRLSLRIGKATRIVNIPISPVAAEG